MKTKGIGATTEAKRRAALLAEAARRAEEMKRTERHSLAMQWAVVWLSTQGVKTSEKSFERAYYAWVRRGGAAEACLDRRRVHGRNHEGAAARRPEFVAYWVRLVMECQRSAKTAYIELVKRWHMGMSIPGYENEWDRRELPEGWSYGNLCRLLPHKAELALQRLGLIAGKDLLPQVRTTRAGGYPMQLVQFDDVWLDRLSRFGAEINRSMQLGALDVYTGMRLSAYTKFRHRRKDGSHVYFEADDMLLEIVALLSAEGYNAQKGTTFVVERGTATVSEELEAMLAAISGGKIRVHRTGMEGRRQLIAAYEGGGKGNPQAKGHIESFHNLLHNRVCHGAGFAGKDRTPPETTAGIIRAEKQHIKNLADLPIDRAALSRGHLPTFYEFSDEVARITGEINRRTDHELTGWAECGWEIHECRLTAEGGWQRTEELLALSPALAGVIEALPKSARRVRRLSPAEAWQRACQEPGNELTRITPEEAALLLSLAKSARIRQEVRPRKGIIAWRDKSGWVDAKELLFESRYVDAAGLPHELPHTGHALTGVVNPLTPQRLYLFDDAGVLLGVCARQNVIPLSDVDAIKEAMGRKNQRTAERLEYLQNILSPYEQEVQAKKEYNRLVADREAPLTLADAYTLPEPAPKRREAHTIPAPAEPSLGLPESYAPSAFAN